jgi:hypothetical protein
VRVVPSQLSQPDGGLEEGEFRSPGREPAAAAIVVETRSRARQRGVGRCARKLVELAVVGVRNPVAPACCFKPCRAQEERLQTKDGLAVTATVAAESMKPRARLVVDDRPAAAADGRRRCRNSRVRAAYDLRRRPRTGRGRGRFQTICCYARPDAITRSATLSATRTLVYVS